MNNNPVIVDYAELEKLNQWCRDTMRKILNGEYKENDSQMLADIIGINMAQNTMFDAVKKLMGK